MSCEFCARDGAAIWKGHPPVLWEYPPEPREYLVAAGCLRELHVRVYAVCSRHLAVFTGMHQVLPCPDCALAPREAVSHLDEVVYRRERS